MLSTVLYYELAMKVPIPVGITVYLLTWGLGHLRCLVIFNFQYSPIQSAYKNGSFSTFKEFLLSLIFFQLIHLTFLRFEDKQNRQTR